MTTTKPTIPPTTPNWPQGASVATHANVYTITYLVLIAAITWGVAWGLSLSWWVALIAGLVLLVVTAGWMLDRLVPRIMGPIIDAIWRKAHSRR